MPLDARRLEAFSRRVERELECLTSETNGLLAAGTRRHVARRLRFSFLDERPEPWLPAPAPEPQSEDPDSSSSSSSSSSETAVLRGEHTTPPTVRRPSFASLEQKLQDKRRESIVQPCVHVGPLFAQVAAVKRRSHLQRLSWKMRRRTCAAAFDWWCEWRDRTTTVGQQHPDRYDGVRVSRITPQRARCSAHGGQREIDEDSRMAAKLARWPVDTAKCEPAWQSWLATRQNQQRGREQACAVRICLEICAGALVCWKQFVSAEKGKRDLRIRRLQVGPTLPAEPPPCYD